MGKRLDKRLIFWLAAVVLMTGVAHSFNMAQYPAFFDDEGTYVSQAMSVLYQGRLAPYTYWYDHAPLGWMLMAFWGFITGGFFTFGAAIVSGRVFMLVLQIISALLLFRIVEKLTKQRVLAFLAVVPFALSPLAVTMHRMVFLDNILTPFLLGSLLLLINQTRLSRILYSGALLAMAVLIKLSMIYFVPAFALMTYFAISKRQRLLAFSGWLAVTGAILALYPLYALLNNELFPTGSWLGGDADHVSLLETAQWQATRPGGFFLDENSAFMGNLRDWLRVDTLYLVLGSSAVLISALWGVFSRSAREQLFLAVITFSYGYYLVRGGIVNTQYVIPLLPLLSIHIGLLLRNVVTLPVGRRQFKSALLAVGLGTLFITAYAQNPAPYTINNTRNQLAAIEWVREEVNNGAVVIVDAYALPDLMDIDEPNIYLNRGAQHYWKVDFDPALTVGVFNDDWTNIDYVMSTNKLEFDVRLRQSEFPITNTALNNYSEVVRLHNVNSMLDVEQVPIADMGDIVIYRVDHTTVTGKN